MKKQPSTGHARYPLDLPPALKQTLKKLAVEDRRSLNLQIVKMLEEHPRVQDGNGKKAVK